jgi:hypothetical protein
MVSVGSHLIRVALPQPPGRDARKRVHQPRDRDLRRVGDEVDMVVVAVELAGELDQVGADFGADAHTSRSRW